MFINCGTDNFDDFSTETHSGMRPSVGLQPLHVTAIVQVSEMTSPRNNKKLSADSPGIDFK